MPGPALQKGTQERSFWKREKGARIISLFQVGIVFLYFFKNLALYIISYLQMSLAQLSPGLFMLILFVCDLAAGLIGLTLALPAFFATLADTHYTLAIYKAQGY